MSSKLSKPLPSLTGIRGIAAIWVVAFHMSDMYWPHVPILRDGYRAVDLFFILSGFIMMHVHQDDFRALKRYETARFFCLRVIRIYPLNTVVLCLMVPFVLRHPAFVDFYHHVSNEHQMIHAFSLGGFWQTLLLANRWFPDLGLWNGPTWSLSVELLAYLTFPLSAYLLSRSDSRVLALFTAFFALLLLMFYLIATHRSEVNAIGFNGIVRGIVGFVSGVALYRFCWLNRSEPNLIRRAAFVGNLACIALLIALLIPHGAMLSSLCFALLIGSLYFQRGAVNAILGSGFVTFLGAISFSLYLVHFFLLQIFIWLLKTGQLEQTRTVILTGFAIYAVLVLIISIAMHVLVERPSLRLGRRLLARLLRPDAQTA